MTKVKLCGLRRPCDMAWANEFRPDYVGFVFAGKKRRVSPEEALRLRLLLDPRIPAIGVFQNEDPGLIRRLVATGVIQAVQLHGGEDDAYVTSLKRQVQVPLIQAVAIASAADVQRAAASRADYILLDHGTGGSGQTFDWHLAKQLTRPYFLAGGLNCQNIKAALALEPFVVDVSSGIETNGVKDYEKIRAFMQYIHEEDML